MVWELKTRNCELWTNETGGREFDDMFKDLGSITTTEKQNKTNLWLGFTNTLLSITSVPKVSAKIIAIGDLAICIFIALGSQKTLVKPHRGPPVEAIPHCPLEQLSLQFSSWPLVEWVTRTTQHSFCFLFNVLGDCLLKGHDIALVMAKLLTVFQGLCIGCDFHPGSHIFLSMWWLSISNTVESVMITVPWPSSLYP